MTKEQIDLKSASFSKEIKKLSIDEVQSLFEKAIDERIKTGNIKCSVSKVEYSSAFAGSSVKFDIVISGPENEWVYGAEKSNNTDNDMNCSDCDIALTELFPQPKDPSDNKTYWQCSKCGCLTTKSVPNL